MRIPPKNRIILSAFILLLNAYAFAQNSPFIDPVAHWIGKEIVFLPIDTSEINEPYNDWSTSRIKTLIPKPYEIYLKKGIIVDVRKDDAFDPYFLTVEIVDSETMLYGKSYDGHLKDVGFSEEYDTALKFVGAILWNERSTFYTYDSVLNVQKHRLVKNLEPLYLWKIEWSPESEKPIRIILFETGRKKFFINLNFSDLNLSPSSKPIYIDDLFHKLNPRITYPDWNDKLWEKIETETISKRMSREAVLLSWGNPIKTESQRIDDDLIETWSYDRIPFVTVTFKNGVLKRWDKSGDK